MSFDAFASAPASAQETPQAVEQTEQTQTSTPEAPVEKTESLVRKQESAPEWTPNFKFKVMDQEHEMDPYFQQFVKSVDDEKKFREMYEKAYGLDVVKPKFQATREKLQSIEPQYNQIMQSISTLRDTYQRGDFDSFFKQLQIPEEKVLQWVVDKAQYSQLPPEQRKVLDDKRSAEEKYYALERETNALRSQYETQVTQAKAQGLQVALERPDVQQFSQVFDARKGAGAFRQEIIDYGNYVWHATQGKVDLTPDQAVSAVLERYQPFVGQQQAPVLPAQQAQVASRQKTIPNLSGRNTTSVGKSKPRSLADLKKLAESMNS